MERSISCSIYCRDKFGAHSIRENNGRWHCDEGNPFPFLVAKRLIINPVLGLRSLSRGLGQYRPERIPVTKPNVFSVVYWSKPSTSITVNSSAVKLNSVV